VRKLKLETDFMQYGKKITGVSTTSDSVTASFADDATATGTHLIGVDGAKAYPRTFLLGPEKVALTRSTSCSSIPKPNSPRSKPSFYSIMNFGINPDFKTFFLLSVLDVTNRMML
jgi:hypothetical protein